MNILTLVKKRCSIRKYKKRAIPENEIKKIVEAGIWGPAVPSFLKIQPWKFIIIKNRAIKRRIYVAIRDKAYNSGVGVNTLLRSAAEIIDKASIIVMIYNSGEMKKIKRKFGLIYAKFEKIINKAELSAISAAIQNMILVAEDLGIGSCWLDTPLLCEKEINSILRLKNELVAILTFGYPAEMGKRSARKPISESIRVIR